MWRERQDARQGNVCGVDAVGVGFWVTTCGSLYRHFKMSAHNYSQKVPPNRVTTLLNRTN